ncbi:tyrosine-type recombinase/integrase [Endothiovibrio diazotrophicus]
MATIRRRGTHWQVQIRKRGYPPQSKSFATRAEGEAWARAVEKGLDGRVIARAEAEQTTLGEALERYLREVTPTKKGAKQDSGRIRRWMAHPLATRTLAAVRGTDIAAYRDERLAEGRNPGTVICDLSILSQVYVVAAKEWGMESLRNPVSVVRKPKKPRSRDRRLEGDEENRLLEVADAPYGELITLAIETAMRSGELRSLKWPRINLKTRTAALPETKNGERRVVPLSSRAVKVLSELQHRSDGEEVFPTLTSADVITSKFRRLCKKAGVAGLRFHDLRHEATSRFFERGLNMMEVAAITGHKDLEMLKRYTHLRAEDLAVKLG